MVPVSFHDGDRHVAGLMKVGTKNISVVVIDDCGVRVIREPKQAERYARPLLRKGQPYPVDRMVRKMLAFGRERGITAAAKELLTAA